MRLLLVKENISDCSAYIECIVDLPYGKASILERERSVYYKAAPFDLYVLLRVLAELFPVIIHMLLNISVIIATRETSIGRGNIGHQLAFYAVGVLVFASVIGLANHLFADDIEQFLIPIATFAVTMFVGAVVVLFSG